MPDINLLGKPGFQDIRPGLESIDETEKEPEEPAAKKRGRLFSFEGFVAGVVAVVMTVAIVRYLDLRLSIRSNIRELTANEFMFEYGDTSATESTASEPNSRKAEVPFDWERGLSVPDERSDSAAVDSATME